LTAFARGPAATFLIESTPHADDPAYRLFHQALADTLHHARSALHPRLDDERALTRAFRTLGQASGWDRAPAYLLRSLPGHATRAHAVDALLSDDAFLLHADLHRLIPAADHAATPTGEERSRLLHLTPRAITAGPAERSAMLDLTHTLEHLTTPLTPHPRAPYAARWAATRPRSERAVLEGHPGGVWGVCAVPGPGGGALLASAGADGTVRLWDPATGGPRAVLEGHPGWVWGVCAVPGPGGGALLASAGVDGTVRLWDPATGSPRAVLQGHPGWVNGVCAVPGPDGTALLASAGDDRTVRLWDPATGHPRAVLEGHTDWVRGVCAVPGPDGTALLASAGDDRTVRLWDPATGHPRAVLQGHTDWVRGVCAVPGPDGTALLASAGDDRTVRLWDPATGHPRQLIPVHHEAYALAAPGAGALAIGLSSGLLLLELRDDTNPAAPPATPPAAPPAWDLS
jgi:hypothetical protein